MTMDGARQVEALEALIGTWRLEASLAGSAEGPRAEATFAWLTGRRFVVQRWEIDHPDAPDGIAILGWDDEVEGLRQHYFDSRGVARVYEMRLADGVWRLWRDAPGFCQRFTGAFSDDGDTIAGAWELSDDGTNWRHDFDLTYHRSGR
jgi:hypothetical protein